jgi:hypothetical protein
MTEDELVDWMAKLWPTVTDGLLPNHCILAARVAVEVGRYFGVPITERAVKVAVFNAKADALAKAGVPTADWPDDAWSVGVGPDDVRSSMSSGYNGHVIAESESYVLDLSAGQFNRPTRDLVVTGPMVLPRGPDPAECWVYGDERGQVLIYEPIPDRGYRDSPDWRDPSNWRDRAGRLIRTIASTRPREGEVMNRRLRDVR